MNQKPTDTTGLTLSESIEVAEEITVEIAILLIAEISGISFEEAQLQVKERVNSRFEQMSKLELKARLNARRTKHELLARTIQASRLLAQTN